MAHFSLYKKALYGPNPPAPHNCQILLHNGEKELAHKNILAAESILFENALFFSADDSTEYVFKGMKEVTKSQFKIFMDWAYLDQLPDLEDATDAFIIANYLDCPKLLGALEESLLSKLNKNEMIDCLINAKNWQFTGLERKILNKIQLGFFKLLEDILPDLLKLNADDFLYVINSQNLNITKMKLEKLCQEWKKQNPNENYEKIADYLKHLQLKNQNIILAIGGGDTQKAQFEAFDHFQNTWKEFPEMNEPSGYRQLFAAETSGSQIFVVGGQIGNAVSHQISCFDLVSSKWKDGKINMSERRKFLAMAKNHTDGSFFIFGGKGSNQHNENQSWRTLEKLNSSKRQTETMLKSEDLNGRKRIVRFKGAQQGRVHHQCAVVNNRLYVIGGFIGWNQNHIGATNTVAIYDISSNQWHTGPSMRSYRQQFAAVVANGKIFAIGGGIGVGQFGETGRTCEVLDVEKSPNQWKNISSMAHARHGCAAAVFNNHIIVSGGGSSTEIYDIENDTWTCAASMKIPRYGHQLVVIPRKEIEDSEADNVLKKYSNF